MQSKPLEPNEPVVLALVDAVTAWQGALEQTLSVSGLSYTKWLLLRAIRQNAFVRHQPFLGAMPIDVACSERLLSELAQDGWVEYSDTVAPRIAEAASTRLERAWQAVKALHSVSVAPFSSQERVALGSLLQRMQLTLSDHSARRSRSECAASAEAAAACRTTPPGSNHRAHA